LQHVSNHAHEFYRRGGKRALDLIIGCGAAVALSPLIGLVALATRLALGSPVLFRQPRAGRDDRPFLLAKFRTMRDLRDADGQLLPDDQRLTAFGALVRRLSLDELPQLWNVINGTMSLVGPRPLLVEYLDRYSPQQARRHEVRPGITGWAQINGRNELGWEERFALDVWYVDRVSLRLDLKILGLTVVRVLAPRGVTAAGHATMPKFMGTRLPAEEEGATQQDGSPSGTQGH
jgi:lipopolysaccharide/colanic/teichoic acid biosynthesis glycosyltransferase